METKKPWESKTYWVGVIMAVLAAFPNIQAFVSAHPMIVSEGVVLVFAVLRTVTSGKISLSDG